MLERGILASFGLEIVNFDCLLLFSHNCSMYKFILVLQWLVFRIIVPNLPICSLGKGSFYSNCSYMVLQRLVFLHRNCSTWSCKV